MIVMGFLFDNPRLSDVREWCDGQVQEGRLHRLWLQIQQVSRSLTESTTRNGVLKWQHIEWLSWTRKIWFFIALPASQCFTSGLRASSKHMGRVQIEAEQEDPLNY
jgi:hypothetical protein